MVQTSDQFTFSNTGDDNIFYRPSLSEKISKQILQLIREEQLKPGDKLPPERNLAEMLSVSRTSLREAMRALSMMKIVDIRQGDGTYVTSLEPELLVENLEIIFSLNSSIIEDVFEFQMLFEPLVAKLAAKKATENEVEFLFQTYEKAISNKNDLDKFLNYLKILRLKLYEISGNPVIIHTLKAISNIIDESSHRHGDIVGVSDPALEKLLLTLNSIKNHDEQGAFEHMQERYEILFDVFKNKFGKGDGQNLY